MGKEYYIYIMANANNTVLYTGVTNNLARWVYEHKNGIGSGFVKRCHVHKLVYYEIGNDIYSAIASLPDTARRGQDGARSNLTFDKDIPY